MTFALEDGRRLTLTPGDPQLRHLDRAWAATVHAFQGRTVDTVIAAMEANHSNLTTVKAFYVEISRARDRAELVTDDALALKEGLEAVTGERISALKGIGESVRIERNRELGKEGKAPRGRERASPEASAPPSPEREREPETSRQKAPEPEPPARGKGIEMDLGLHGRERAHLLLRVIAPAFLPSRVATSASRSTYPSASPRRRRWTRPDARSRRATGHSIASGRSVSARMEAPWADDDRLRRPQDR